MNDTKSVNIEIIEIFNDFAIKNFTLIHVFIPTLKIYIKLDDFNTKLLIKFFIFINRYILSSTIHRFLAESRLNGYLAQMMLYNYQKKKT